LKDKATTIKSK